LAHLFSSVLKIVLFAYDTSLENNNVLQTISRSQLSARAKIALPATELKAHYKEIYQPYLCPFAK